MMYNIGMDYTNKDFLERRPQRLCLMCGRCCRMAVASIPHSELLKKTEEGDESSKEFLEIFEPYATIEEALKADEATVKNIPDWENRTFYHCRFIRDDNLCSRYETRYEVCRIFPSSPWAVIPPNCGFRGWMFNEVEAHKRKIRKLKEESVYYNAKLKTNIPNKEKQLYKKLIDKISERVKLYEKYGSQYW